MTQPPSQQGAAEVGAGGVVFRGDGQVLLVRYRSGAWAFPKGHIEPGETPEQTAVREVEEETGVRASVVSALSPTRYVNDRGRAREIGWFRMATAVSALRLEDTFGEGGFFDSDTALTLLSYPEDQKLLREALGQLGA